MSTLLLYDRYQEGRKMKYEIVELGEKIVEGIGIRTTNQEGKAMQDIAKLWEEFYTKGKYAKFVITGDVQKAVGKAWIQIWNMNLKRKYTCDFEEYQNNTDDMQNQEIHLYIAVE